MRKYTLKNAALRTLQVLIILVTALITALAAVYLSSFRILMITLLAVCWGLAAIFVLFLLPLYFRRTVIYISTTEISIHSGLFFTWREHMRADSVQYCSYVRVPLSSLTGFNFIALHALGATVVLPFLSKKDAEEIVAVVNSRISGG